MLNALPPLVIHSTWDKRVTALPHPVADGSTLCLPWNFFHDTLLIPTKEGFSHWVCIRAFAPTFYCSRHLTLATTILPRGPGVSARPGAHSASLQRRPGVSLEDFLCGTAVLDGPSGKPSRQVSFVVSPEDEWLME